MVCLFGRGSPGRGIVSQVQEAPRERRPGVLQLGLTIVAGGGVAVGADAGGGGVVLGLVDIDGGVGARLSGREDEELVGGGVGIHFDKRWTGSRMEYWVEQSSGLPE